MRRDFKRMMSRINKSSLRIMALSFISAGVTLLVLNIITELNIAMK